MPVVQRCIISGNMACLGRLFLSLTKVRGKRRKKRKTTTHTTPKKSKLKPPFTSFCATEELHCIFYL